MNGISRGGEVVPSEKGLSVEVTRAKPKEQQVAIHLVVHHGVCFSG